MITAVAAADLNLLSVDALVELIEIDASAPNIGSGVLRYCNQTDTNGGSVALGGNVYSPFPVEMTGIEHSTKDASNSPTLTIGNITSSWSTLILLYQDMIGAKVTRRKILAKYLDGHPSAASSNGLPADVFYINRKLNENWQLVSFELGSELDVEGVMVPNMKCNANHCVVRYRSAECSFVGRATADKYGNLLTPGAATGAWALATSYIVGDESYLIVDGIRFYAVCTVAHLSSASILIFNPAYWAHDQCSKRLNTGCELRFDNEVTGLPFLAFPGMTRLPV